jgi:hypothetical protein
MPNVTMPRAGANLEQPDSGEADGAPAHIADP